MRARLHLLLARCTNPLYLKWLLLLLTVLLLVLGLLGGVPAAGACPPGWGTGGCGD